MAPPIKGLRGLTFADMKKYPANIPMFVMLSIATGLAITASIRTATKNPDVSFNRKGNPAPWEEYKDKQYKFFGIGRDWSQKWESPAPLDYKTSK